MKQTGLGIIATLLSASSLIPLVYETVIKRSTRSINYLYTGIGFAAQIFWLIYGIINKDGPLVALSLYLMVVYIAITISKFHYEKNKTDMQSQLKHKYSRHTN